MRRGMGAEPCLVIILKVPEREFGILEVVGFEVRDNLEEAVAIGIAARLFEEGKEGAVAELRVCGGSSDSPMAGLLVELGVPSVEAADEFSGALEVAHVLD